MQIDNINTYESEVVITIFLPHESIYILNTLYLSYGKLNYSHSTNSTHIFP